MTADRPVRPKAAWFRQLTAPNDVAALVGFRIVFGLLAGGEAYRLISNDIVNDLWAEPSVRLTSSALAALPPVAGDAATLYFLALALLGIAVALGLCFRTSCLLLALGYAYPVVVCPSAFVAEFGLFSVVALLLAVSPAQRRLSADAWLRPARASDWGPAWPQLALRVQFALVQLSAGLALLNGDWLRGYPLQLWLPERTRLPLLGWLHAEPSVAVGISWVLVLVLLPGSLALWSPRARRFAFAALTGVLVWLQQAFDLGALPWLLIAGNTLFFAGGWPRVWFNWPQRQPEAPASPHQLPAAAIAAAACLGVQLVWLPLPWIGGGGATWSAGGYAIPWQLIVASKGGAVQLSLRDPATGERTHFDPDAELTWWQYRRVATHPELLRRYAHRVAARVDAAGRARPEVRALTLVTLNGREPQRLVDPTVDLAAVEDVETVLLPLEVPLARQWKGQSDWPAPVFELTTRARPGREQPAEREPSGDTAAGPPPP